MKKYYIVRGNFANVYNLYWATEDMKKYLPEEAERISRKEAIKLCIKERARIKNDYNFSGYASASITPPDKVFYECGKDFELIGYIWEYKQPSQRL